MPYKLYVAEAATRALEPDEKTHAREYGAVPQAEAETSEAAVLSVYLPAQLDDDALDALGVPASRALMVGDNAHDDAGEPRAG